MAQRRMFSKKITETDRFIEMPLSSQALYFHLNMGADDEGFIDKAKTIQRTIGASDDDMKLLIVKGFLLPFESGVVVIRHWRIHNYIQADRFQSTIHQPEKAQLEYDQTKAAILKPVVDCIQDVSKTETQVRLGKNRLDKVSLTTYTEEIIAYLNELTNSRFKPTTKETQKLIKGLIKQGYTVDDFKLVIKSKTDEWLHKIGVPAWQKNNNMEIHLTPKTLFKESHFENYLNAAKIKAQAVINDTPDERLGF